MSVIDEKIKRFETIIFSDVDAKINAVMAEADQHKKAALAEHHEKVMDEYFDYMQKQVKEIESDVRQRISWAELDAQRELLLYRNQLSDKVFSSVKSALLSFTETDDYSVYLSEHIRKSIETSKLGSVSILLRKEDLALVRADQFPAASVTKDDSIRLGGFVLLDEENGVIIDESFDSRLEELTSYFNQTSGLSLNQQ